MSTPGRWLAPAMVAAVVLPVAGCQEATPPQATAYSPATVGEADQNGVHEVRFTRVGADRVGLRTVAARREGSATVVDYAALIYDSTGKPWVFAAVGPRAFRRVPVQVERVDGDRVWLAGGPAPGVPVVTVGAAEVWGAELGIAGGH